MNRILSILLSPIINFFPKGFPKKKLIPLLLLQICESFLTNSITSYAGFMVTDFGLVESTNDAGYYSGILTSSYFFAQFFSSFFIGVISDNIGRRPVMLFGSFSSIISTILFGFSWNYWWAVGMRMFNGFVNGNIGVIKTFMGEFSTKENRTQVFGLIGLTNGFGMIVGAAIGGYLARPAIQYPKIFGNIQFFKTFPFILPNIFCAVMIIIGVTAGYFFLEETKPRQKTDKPWYIDIWDLIKKIVERTIKIVKMLFSKEYVGILCCFCYSIISTGVSMLWTIVPLLMMASVDVGGFGWETGKIGTYNMTNAISIILTQIFIYRRTVKFFGPLTTNKIGSLGNFIMFSMPPFLNYILGYGEAVLWTGLVICGFLINMFNQYCFSSIMAMIANSVTSDLLGTLNGLSQSLVALFRCIAPIVSSQVMAWSLGNKFPFNAHFTFFTVSCVSLLNFFALFFLPKSINEPKEAPKYTQLQQVEMDEEDNKENTDVEKKENGTENQKEETNVNKTEEDKKEETVKPVEETQEGIIEDGEEPIAL